jgi:glycosyltransferase involved in cell wall biosynthesis
LISFPWRYDDRSMRILKVVQAYYPFQEAGGPVVKVRALAHGLARRGHDVTILTADLGLAGRQAPTTSFERCEWGWRSEQDGVKVIYLSTLAHCRALTINPRVIGFSRILHRGFDLVHVYGIYDLIGPVVGSSCRHQQIPYVIEPMGMFRPIVRSIWLKQLYHWLPGKAFIGGARFLIATSDQERQELIDCKIAPARIIVRRNGVEVPDKLPERGPFRRQWAIPENAKLVLYLGRLISKKSPDLLIESFAQWQKKSGRAADSVLVLAGPNEGDGYLPRLKRMADQLGLRDAVRFVGPLYDDAKWQAYRDADVFVLPSQNENFGNTAAESAACGTPVIVTESCGIASFVKAAGLVVPHTGEDLERALTELLGDPMLRQRYQQGCAEMGRSLSWTGPISENEKLYERCVAGMSTN